MISRYQVHINTQETKQVQAGEIAVQVDADDYRNLNSQTLGLLYLANSGTGIGGARPKALIYDQEKQYLAKFNRHHDSFNNARVELACLLMAQAAGISMGNGKIVEVRDREVLLLERFDVQQEHRKHLITANGLLKNTNTQQDPGHSFRYNDLHALVQKYSNNIKKDLEQLLKQMLFNRAINNTDDHERNFSFIHETGGYQLSPAYDLVPSLAFGEYHAAGFDYQPYPPTPKEAEKKGRIFGLPQGEVQHIAQQVQAAVDNWLHFAEKANVSEKDAMSVQRVLTR